MEYYIRVSLPQKPFDVIIRYCTDTHILKGVCTRVYANKDQNNTDTETPYSGSHPTSLKRFYSGCNVWPLDDRVLYRRVFIILIVQFVAQ